jgi:hypothetical protein
MSKRPKSRTWQAQVVSGLRISGWILVAFLTVSALLVGAKIVFSDSSKVEVSNLRLAQVAGWIAFFVGATVVGLTVRWWAKWLPSLLLIATLNSALMVWTGHMLNEPDRPVSRPEMLVATILMAACTMVSAHFYDRKLDYLDRIVLLSFVACFVWGSVSGWTFPPLIVGLLLLVLGWARNRIQEQRHVRRA